jgi:UDP-MurNAc hydroxylase
VITGDGQTLLDLNDARLFPVQFRGIRQEVGGDIDLFAFQGAGASWYPMCYPYPDERREQLSRQKRLAKFAYAASAIRVVEPIAALPFAGPPCFLDPEIFRHNDEMETGIFPHQEQVAEWLAGQGIDNTVVLFPGDAWDATARRKDTDPIWNGFSLSERGSYLEAYAQRRRSQIEEVMARYPDPTESLWDPFQDYFRRLLEMSPYFNDRIGMRVGFDITGPGGGKWAADFRPGAEGVEDRLGECGYTYRFASRWLPSLLSGATPWEDFFLSLRFEAWRDPDVYNDHLLGLLKFAEPEALEAVEAFETSMDSDERITIHAEGKSYSIGRYCPHAGNDLLNTAEILPGGIVRCLAHHYEFELETGRCVNGNCSPLDVEVLEESAAEPEPQTHGSVESRELRTRLK